MRRLILGIVLGVALGAAGAFLALRGGGSAADRSAAGGQGEGSSHADAGSSAATVRTVSTGAKKAPLYRCPMHPQITSDHPGTCPLCGMTLVLVDDGDAHGAGGTGAGDGAGSGEAATGVPGLDAVSIDEHRQQLMGLRTTAATRAAMTGSWRTVGRVVVDPTRVRRVNVKVECYVEKAFVDFVGKPVRKGQPLLSVYSPSLLAAQEEFLLALSTTRRLGTAGPIADSSRDLLAASRRKLELWDVPQAEIARLEQTGQPSKFLTLVSPISGVVTAKSVVDGATLKPGDTPYEITDLGMVWVMADAYESDLANVRVGMPAALTLDSYPGRVFKGRVEFIDPLMDPRTRTLKVHLHFANPRRELVPEMFGEVSLQGKERMALTVPVDAVIRAGKRDVVFMALGDGRFSPREVRLGARDRALVEVLEGLSEGDRVVTRANFLVDSESRLRASLSALKAK